MWGSHVLLVRTVFADAVDEAFGREPVLVFRQVHVIFGFVHDILGTVVISILGGVADVHREHHRDETELKPSRGYPATGYGPAVPPVRSRLGAQRGSNMLKLICHCLGPVAPAPMTPGA